MRKILILMLLCAPLGWVAWQESKRLTGNPSDGAIEASPKDTKGTEATLKSMAKIKAEAEEINNLPEGVSRAVLHLDGPPAGVEAKGPIARAVIGGVAAHARRREEFRNRANK